MIDVLVPTYGRAGRLERVRRNIADNTFTQHQVTFIVEADDDRSLLELDRIGARWVVNQRSRNYAGAINTGYEASDCDFMFTGADDLNFHPGWDIKALKAGDDWFQVVGTNDLLNPYVLAGTHATHYLVDRRYLDDIGGVVDQGPGSFMCELYTHQFTDTEFVGTAKARVRFRPCLEAVVEHLHFTVGKSERDATYEFAYDHLDDDSALYDERRELWQTLSR